jgi:hypothetical protein
MPDDPSRPPAGDEDPTADRCARPAAESGSDDTRQVPAATPPSGPGGDADPDRTDTAPAADGYRPL